MQDRIRAAGRRDDDVGLGQLDRDGVEWSRPSADALGQLLGALERAAGDDALCPAPAQVARSQLAHPAGAEEQGALAFETPELALGEIDCGRGNGLGHLGQLRLGANALARVERILEEPVQDRARRAGAERRFVGVANLPEDLPLAGHERVETGRDAEQVLDRLATLPARQDGLELQPGLSLERAPRNLRVAALEVDLGPVAGREHDRAELLRELDRVPVCQVEPFPQLERRMAMRHADSEQTLRFMRISSHLGPGTMLA